MNTTQSPVDKLKRNLTMPEKFLTLKAQVEEVGTESQKQLMQLAEDYIAGLNNMFYDREVTEFMLKEFDFPDAIKELNHAGLLEGKNAREIMLLIMDIRHIVRHTWELTGSDGQTKTGDDLRKAWPSMWEDDKTRTVNQLLADIKTMQK
jgi:hypothetical protein